MNCPEKLAKIGNLIVSQDNRCTGYPMFCVQVNKRIVGLVEGFGNGNCWHDSSDFESGVVYERPEDSDSDKWECYGYADNWVTVMVAFTEEGCKEHLRLNGHNYRHYDGVRIYAESFHRCPEMLEIREWLINQSSDKRADQEKIAALAAELARIGKMLGGIDPEHRCPRCGGAMTINDERGKGFECQSVVRSDGWMYQTGRCASEATTKLENAKSLLARALHYPEHWDTMCYPTLADAVKEWGGQTAFVCQCIHAPESYCEAEDHKAMREE